MTKIIVTKFEMHLSDKWQCVIYREKVSIPAFKSFITIEGAGADKTIVQWGDTAQTPNPSAKGQRLGTYGSATFAVNSPYFIAKNITFKVSSNKNASFLN
jgi:pectin methylesterase-like acyl-CoA thioesterase